MRHCNARQQCYELTLQAPGPMVLDGRDWPSEDREQLGSCCILFPHICKHPGEEHQLGAWNQRSWVPDLALLARFYNVDNSELSQSHY